MQAEDSVSHDTNTLEHIFIAHMATSKRSKMIIMECDTTTVPELEASFQSV